MNSLQLHPENPHYLSFRGRPTVLVTSAEHYGSVLNLDFDYVRYLQTLAKDGMNYTRIFTGAYLEMPGAFGIRDNNLAPAPGRYISPWARSDQPGYANGGNKFDLACWDEAYFARLKNFVELAGRHGIVVEVTLFSSIYDDNNWRLCPFFPDSNINSLNVPERRMVQTLHNMDMLRYQEALTRKVVTELNGFDNVIFELQNEPWADRPQLVEQIINPEAGMEWQTRVEQGDAESLAWQRAVAGWISETEEGLAHRHLIAQNYVNFYARLEEVDPRISILNFHYVWPEAVRLNASWKRVVSFDESGFSGSADATYRRQAWRFMLAGGGIFNNLDYSFSVGHEDGKGSHQAPGGGSPTLRQQLKLLRETLDGFDYIHASPVDLGRDAQALVNADGGALVYLSKEAIQAVLDLPGGSYAAAWASPESGDILDEQSIAHAGGQMILRAPLSAPDVYLTVKKVK